MGGCHGNFYLHVDGSNGRSSPRQARAYGRRLRYSPGRATSGPTRRVEAAAGPVCKAGCAPNLRDCRLSAQGTDSQNHYRSTEYGISASICRVGHKGTPRSVHWQATSSMLDRSRRIAEEICARLASRHAANRAHAQRSGPIEQAGARRNVMKLRVGYELQYDFPQPTPVIMMLNVHYTRVSDLERPDHIVIGPSVPISGYRDGFGNWCSRILAPAGAMRISTDTVVSDTGLPDPIGAGRRADPGRGASGRGARLPACQPVLRQRPLARSGLDPVRPDRSPAGRACRPSATSCTSTSPSATSTRG